MAGKGKFDSTLSAGIDLLDAGSHRFILETFFNEGKHTLNVHDADIHVLSVNDYFHRHTGVTTTLTAATVPGVSTTLSVADGSGIANGDDIQLEDGTVENTFPRVISGGGTNTLTIDRPIDLLFNIGDNVSVISTNLAVVGSLASPVSFRMVADADQTWHIVRFLLGMVHTTEADDSRFGNIAGGLTNGVVLRGFDATAGRFRTFTNWKTNDDIKMDMFDVSYSDKAGAGLFGTNGRGSIKIGTGAVPRLDGAAGDFLEILIQDNISALNLFRLKGQGHVENI